MGRNDGFNNYLINFVINFIFVASDRLQISKNTRKWAFMSYKIILYIFILHKRWVQFIDRIVGQMHIEIMPIHLGGVFVRHSGQASESLLEPENLERH